MWAEKVPELHDVLLRRTWLLFTNWVSMLRERQQGGKGPERTVVIARCLAAGGLQANETALLCRIFGGFLTSLSWVQRALSSPGQRPLCVFYQGIGKGVLTVHLSEKLRAARTQVCDLFRCLRDLGFRSVRLLDSVEELRHAYRRDLSARGERSRPWTRVNCLALDSTDQTRLQEAHFPDHARAVCTLSDWLDSHSPAKPGECPGYWK